MRQQALTSLPAIAAHNSMSKKHTRRYGRQMAVTDSAKRSFQQFMDEHNRAYAQAAAEEEQDQEDTQAQEAFAERFLRKMRTALGLE